MNLIHDSAGGWQGSVGELVETGDGYIWNYKKETFVFNHQGLLVEYVDDGKINKLEYDDLGHLSRFVTYEAMDYFVDTDNEGRVLRFPLNGVSSENDVVYRYEEGLITYSADAVSAVEYRYIDDGEHKIPGENLCSPK